MTRIRVPLMTVLLIVSVSSAPNHIDHQLQSDLLEDSPINLESYDVTAANVRSETITADAPRTLLMYGLLTWLFGVVKAMIKPARNLYIMMGPEISAFRCLSDSREFQDAMGFSGSDFEGYVYETPRTSDRKLPADHQSYVSNQLDDTEAQQDTYIPQFSRPRSPVFNETVQTVQHRTDALLKRIPRFIDEFASLLKKGQAMNCIMPYMRERVTRWMDS